MIDETEPMRRERVFEIHQQIASENKEKERQRLQEKYGKVWDLAQLAMEFEIIGFSAPLVVVKRLSDGVKGSLEFQHHPRLYFNFEEHQDD
jgi:hypothetical protein